jgi:Tol biopolymer transport system component
MRRRSSTVRRGDCICTTCRLKTLPTDGQHPSWSPAADRIAFDDGVKTRIYDVTLDTTIDFAEGTEPSWTADGTSIAVRGGANRVDLVDVGSGTRRELIARRHVSVPRWSADGGWMMYSYSGGGRSLGEASSEPHQIIVRNTKTAAEGTVGVFYKANPGDYSWVASEQFCRMTK